MQLTTRAGRKNRTLMWSCGRGNSSRSTWPELGRVKELMKGRDEYVGGAVGIVADS